MRQHNTIMGVSIKASVISLSGSPSSPAEKVNGAKPFKIPGLLYPSAYLPVITWTSVYYNKLQKYCNKGLDPQIIIHN